LAHGFAFLYLCPSLRRNDCPAGFKELRELLVATGNLVDSFIAGDLLGTPVNEGSPEACPANSGPTAGNQTYQLQRSCRAQVGAEV
jgi:hypothetical protein